MSEVEDLKAEVDKLVKLQVEHQVELGRLRKDYKFYREDSFSKAEQIHALSTEVELLRKVIRKVKDVE